MSVMPHIPYKAVALFSLNIFCGLSHFDEYAVSLNISVGIQDHARGSCGVAETRTRGVT